MTARPLRRPCALLAAGAALFLLGTGARLAPALHAVTSWAIQLQNIDPLEIRASPYDLVVIDYGFSRLNPMPFPREVLGVMRNRPDGRRRVILAYINIGEADDFRYYWQPGWLAERPDWFGLRSASSPGSYLVKYWHPAWQALLMASVDSEAPLVDNPRLLD